MCADRRRSFAAAHDARALGVDQFATQRRTVTGAHELPYAAPSLSPVRSVRGFYWLARRDRLLRSGPGTQRVVPHARGQTARTGGAVPTYPDYSIAISESLGGHETAIGRNPRAGFLRGAANSISVANAPHGRRQPARQTLCIPGQSYWTA